MLAFLAFLPLLAPGQAHAYTFYEPDLGYNEFTGEFDHEFCPGEGLTRRIMPCIKETLLNVTNELLIPISEYMSRTITLVCVLAVVLLGILMVGGKTTAPFKDTLLLIVKLAAISMFTWNFGGVFGMLLDAMEQMLDIVSSYVFFSDSFNNAAILQDCPDYARAMYEDSNSLKVWVAVDCSINSLIGGIYGDFSLTMGITGFLLSCFTSNTMGMFIGLIGIRLILQLLWAVIRSLYIFVTSYVAVCILVLISPFFIPAILFQATHGYFERWLRILLSFIIQPIILFTYMGMLLTAFDLVVFSGNHSLAHVIAGDAAKDPNFRKSKEDGGFGGIGGWLMEEGGGYGRDYKMPAGININSRGTQEQTEVLEGDEEYMPRTVDTGIEGMQPVRVVPSRKVAAGMDMDPSKQRDLLSKLGVGGFMDAAGRVKKNDKLNLFEFSVPVETVDWAFLAKNSHFNPDSDASMLRYMIKVLLSFFMALITGYVFVELLDTLPFIASGLAGSSVDAKMLGTDGATSSLSRMAPPGSDFMKNLREKTLGGGAGGG